MPNFQRRLREVDKLNTYRLKFGCTSGDLEKEHRDTVPAVREKVQGSSTEISSQSLSVRRDVPFRIGSSCTFSERETRVSRAT